MTRWLDEEEQAAWRAFYSATTLLIDRLDRELQHDAGMPHAYYEILVVLSESEGRSLRMSELALQTRSSRSRLSHAVTKLEARGWVRRRDCDDDKRGQFADLTDQGFAALVAAAPGHVETVRTHLFDPLTPEQIDQLKQISQAISETLKT
ncbi:MarR family transcriptional regulator [Dactylosporangium sp. NPDC000555]|uniref:MarR family winged helix-turn-helix transcriptional regulator n=1 Tax=Dactylosporangium sp. NPDC000555 TaxID=3154260 RepID=UPI0033300A6F